ncbi:aprataxin and PNK-like factor isoform X2 [Drosophila eugracilis]|nr:aprataxin and PNK-like factor isoform X2 [Drosophila eugracilis]
MSLEDKENVVHKVEETEDSKADSGTKRKSPSEALDSNSENLETDTSPIKRMKSEEPLVSVKDEPNTDTPVKIKSEPVDDVDEPATSSDTIQVKTEPTTNRNSPAAIKTEPTNSSAQAAVDSSVSSSSTRISCRFGIRCYRRNPAHRSAEAHPGDQDYRRPNFPDPPLGTPACPFGNACYRRNPVHFQEHSHPAD